MTVASFVAAQRTEQGVPHALSCRALEVPESWFYKWKDGLRLAARFVGPPSTRR